MIRYVKCLAVAFPTLKFFFFSKQVRPGIWFPEEAFDDEAKRSRLFDDATRGAFMWERQEEQAAEAAAAETLLLNKS